MRFVGPGSEQLRWEVPSGHVVEPLGVVDDLSEAIASTDIALAPLAAGAGVKTKMLDYLALGCRVVATPIAVEGIEGCPGVEVANLDDFAARVEDAALETEPPEDRRRRIAAQRRWLAARMSSTDAQASWTHLFADIGFSFGESADS